MSPDELAKALLMGLLSGAPLYPDAMPLFEKIKTLVPSGRGELEITDVNNAYIREETMTFSFLDGWWTDAGTFESLLRAGNLVAQSRRVQPAPRVLEKVNA